VKSRLFWLLLPLPLALAGGLFWQLNRETANAAPTPTATPAATPSLPSTPEIPVLAGEASARDVPVYLFGLGAVQAFNTVTVKARVDGQIDRIGFVEGQEVKAGDVIAQIDPRPFEATLAQMQAAKAKDEAQLVNAKLDLERNLNLAQAEYRSRQAVDTQRALVAQLTAAIQGDQAQIDNARVQLGYTTMTAPISGRTGVRLVDQGNIVRAGDTTGLVVITQLKPISVIFTLPQDHLDAVVAAMAKGPLKVLAYKRDGTTLLGEGRVALVDNLIDPAVGTIRLKATFPNDDLKLWPGGFVSARLLLEVRRGAVTVAAPVVQRGPKGPYAYVIKPDRTVELRLVKLGPIQDGVAIIESGLAAGERVVLDGQYKLRPGYRVNLPAAQAAGTAKPAPAS
jgi:multidrug efflux system membrane fusion protein